MGGGNKDGSKIMRPKNLSIEELLKAINSSIKELHQGTIPATISTTLLDIKAFLESSEDTVFDAYLIAEEVGVIPAGFNKLYFFNDGLTDVIVNGVILPSGLSRPYEASSLQNTLPAISYDVQTSKLAITGNKQ